MKKKLEKIPLDKLIEIAALIDQDCGIHLAVTKVLGRKYLQTKYGIVHKAVVRLAIIRRMKRKYKYQSVYWRETDWQKRKRRTTGELAASKLLSGKL